MQIAAFMASMSTKGETFEELAGVARAMRSRAKRIQVIKNLLLILAVQVVTVPIPSTFPQLLLLWLQEQVL